MGSTAQAEMLGSDPVSALYQDRVDGEKQNTNAESTYRRREGVRGGSGSTWKFSSDCLSYLNERKCTVISSHKRLGEAMLEVEGEKNEIITRRMWL